MDHISVVSLESTQYVVSTTIMLCITFCLNNTYFTTVVGPVDGVYVNDNMGGQ